MMQVNANTPVFGGPVSLKNLASAYSLSAPQNDLSFDFNSAIIEVDHGLEFDRRHNHAVVSDPFAAAAAVPDQTHMRAALDHLLKEKRSLGAANDNKEGHRVKALGHVDKAIDEGNRGTVESR